MYVSLTAESEARVKALKLAKLREQLQVGVDHIARGESHLVTSESELDVLFIKIKG